MSGLHEGDVEQFVPLWVEGDVVEQRHRSAVGIECAINVQPAVELIALEREGVGDECRGLELLDFLGVGLTIVVLEGDGVHHGRCGRGRALVELDGLLLGVGCGFVIAEAFAVVVIAQIGSSRSIDVYSFGIEGKRIRERFGLTVTNSVSAD